MEPRTRRDQTDARIRNHGPRRPAIAGGAEPAGLGHLPRLTDGVIRLDAYTLDDAVAQVAGEDEEHARRFGWYPQRSTLEGVTSWIRARQADWEAGRPTRAFAVREAATGQLLGGCELRLQPDGRAEMSYWIFPPFRRRGFASRAARLASAFAFERLGVKVVALEIAADNLASRGVARATGFRLAESKTTAAQPNQTIDPPNLRYYLRR